MPTSVKKHLDQLFLKSFENEYMSQMGQTRASNAFGMHTINMAEKANMMAMMRNWIADHEVGASEDVFTEEFKEFAQPLRSKKARAVLDNVAATARQSGGNALHAQIAAAAKLRKEKNRSKLFGWDNNDTNAHSAVHANLEAALQDNRKNLLKGEVVTSVASRDATTLATSALQASVLDALLHKHGQIRLLFTTWKLVQGTIFLRVLASSLNLYDRGFIMNPTILRANAPSASSINWDIRLNDFFLHSGIHKSAAFVFVTSSVDYSTFLDPLTMDEANRKLMMASPIGSRIPGFKAPNYPVKPGGSEILTLLEYGYDIATQDAPFYADAKLGFVMVPGQRAGARKERFLKMHSSFTQEKYERLLDFMKKLKTFGIMV